MSLSYGKEWYNQNRYVVIKNISDTVYNTVYHLKIEPVNEEYSNFRDKVHCLSFNLGWYTSKSII